MYIPGRREDEPLGGEADLDGGDSEGEEEETEGVGESTPHRLRVIRNGVTLQTPRVQHLQTKPQPK